VVEAPGFLGFSIVGSDTQIGLAMCKYLDVRRIPYSSLSSNDVANLDDWLAENTHPYVLNALIEEQVGEQVRLDAVQIVASNSLAKHCADNEIVMVHISNSVVFSGRSSRAYIETDELEPRDDYGQRCSDLEKEVQTICPRSIILRTSWVFSENENNFLTKLVAAATTKETLRVSGSLKGCPTDAHVIARVVVGMCEQVDCKPDPDLWGIYHYVDSDVCSMHTFAKTVITLAKSMTDIKVETIEEGDGLNMHEGEGLAELESYELNCKKILSVFGIKQRPWRRGVQAALKLKFPAAAS